MFGKSIFYVHGWWNTELLSFMPVVWVKSQQMCVCVVASMSRPIPVLWVCPLVNYSWWFRATSPFNSPSFLSASMSICLSRLCESVPQNCRSVQLELQQTPDRSFWHGNCSIRTPSFPPSLSSPTNFPLISLHTATLSAVTKGQILIEWIQAGLQPKKKCVCVCVQRMCWTTVTYSIFDLKHLYKFSCAADFAVWKPLWRPIYQDMIQS